MEQSGFYPSINGDRKYLYTFLSNMIAAIIKSGVYNGELGVAPTGGAMSVTLPVGRAWVNGIYYENTKLLVLPLTQASGTYARYTAVAIRHNANTRATTAVLIDGAAASAPLKPQPVRTSEIYDLIIAYIYVKAGAIKIELSDIEDTRLNNALCGITTGVVSQVDTTTLFTRLQADILTLEELIKNIENNSAYMLSAIYDTNHDGVVDKADEATDQTARNSIESLAQALSATLAIANSGVTNAAAAQATANTAVANAAAAQTTASSGVANAATALAAANAASNGVAYYKPVATTTHGASSFFFTLPNGYTTSNCIVVAAFSGSYHYPFYATPSTNANNQFWVSTATSGGSTFDKIVVQHI